MFLHMYACAHETITTIEIMSISVVPKIRSCPCVNLSSCSFTNARTIIDLLYISVDVFISRTLHKQKYTVYTFFLYWLFHSVYFFEINLSCSMIQYLFLFLLKSNLLHHLKFVNPLHLSMDFFSSLRLSQIKSPKTSGYNSLYEHALSFLFGTYLEKVLVLY